jgi:hypothetical protein
LEFKAQKHVVVASITFTFTCQKVTFIDLSFNYLMPLFVFVNFKSELFEHYSMKELEIIKVFIIENATGKVLNFSTFL